MGVTSATRTGCLIAILGVFAVVAILAIVAINKPVKPANSTIANSKAPRILPRMSEEDLRLMLWVSINSSFGKGSCDHVSGVGTEVKSTSHWVATCANGRRYLISPKADGIGNDVVELSGEK